MRLQERIRTELKYLRGLIRTLWRVSSIKANSPTLICDDLEAAVDAWRERGAMVFEGRTLSYGDLDALANRYAHWAAGQGLRRGQVVALIMANRLDYLAVWYGLSKVGAVTALINNNLSGASLCHCLDISQAAHVIADAEGATAFEGCRTSLAHSMALWTVGEAHGEQRDMTKALRSCSGLRPDRAVREGLTARDPVLLIYTSGTTGLPKAARITHMRAQLYMRGFAAATGARKDDRVYVALPLYHATGGLCGVGAALLSGGAVVLRQKFSASHFWDDVVAEAATMFVYIGELCRYLVNQPPQAGERAHKLRLAFGNGLRPDVWDQVRTRFGVAEVLEFYGSTEGNVSMFNFDGRVGAVGRTPFYLRGLFNIRLIRFDIETETPVRGADGRCQGARAGEIGECIGAIRADARTEFAGYADPSANEKKILHDVFASGDRWFATGDLMRQDEDGYFYFVDRIGDTFRWKGENVSTSEVAQQLATAPGVQEATVYGVKVGDLDGRAGMASLVVARDFDLAAFARAVDTALPAFARPVFIRLQPEIEITGTFKYRKMDLVADGFDPAKIRQPLFVRGPRGYQKVTKAVFDKVQSGAFRV